MVQSFEERLERTRGQRLGGARALVLLEGRAALLLIDALRLVGWNSTASPSNAMRTSFGWGVFALGLW